MINCKKNNTFISHNTKNEILKRIKLPHENSVTCDNVRYGFNNDL